MEVLKDDSDLITWGVYCGDEDLDGETSEEMNFFVFTAIDKQNPVAGIGRAEWDGVVGMHSIFNKYAKVVNRVSNKEWP